MNERPDFIPPPNNPLEVSKQLVARMEKDTLLIEELGGSPEDIQTMRTAIRNLRKRFEDDQPDSLH